MAGVILEQFSNPGGNTDGEITGLEAVIYPITLNAGNSYTLNYFGSYNLIYDPATDVLGIYDGATQTVRYAYDIPLGRYKCVFDTFNRASVLSTYFETATPPIYIRPVTGATQIRYNWITSNALAQSYILTCVPTDGGAGGGTVVLDSNVSRYTFDGLTFGKTYEGAINGSNASGLGVSSIYRTTVTGNPPDPPSTITFTNTSNTVSFAWNAPEGVQTPPIGWYAVKDANTLQRYSTRYYTSNIFLPFNGTSNDYVFQSVSDTGYGPGVTIAVTAGTVPDAPVFNSVTTGAGSGEINIDFTVPSDGGSAITSYAYALSNDGYTTYYPFVPSGSEPNLTYTITGLVPETLYSIKLIATNGVGSSLPSAPGSATSGPPASPPTVPSAPVFNIVLTGTGSGEINIDFSVPSDGGSAITSYSYALSDDGYTTYYPFVPAGSEPNLFYTISGLVPETLYSIKLIATNSVGSSSPSAPGSAFSGPPPP